MASYLQIENISKSYGPKVLFEHIDFNINEGDKVALIAPNGTGKTSLLRILAGKDKSDSGGKILFLKDIRIAFLEQEYAYDPEKSIFRQIMDGSTEWTEHLDQDHLWEYERRVQRLLTQFSLTDWEKPMKDLSGGEVQRLAIARAFLKDAPIVILDEATAFADPENEYLVQRAFEELSADRTVLMIAHRLTTVRRADRIYVMDGGRISEYGTHDEMASGNGRYSRMWKEYTESVDWKIGGTPQ